MLLNDSGLDASSQGAGDGGAAIVLLLAGWAAAETRTEAVVLAPVENVYGGPDAGQAVVSQAVIGQVVAVLETEGGFARIETPTVREDRLDDPHTLYRGARRPE